MQKQIKCDEEKQREWERESVMSLYHIFYYWCCRCCCRFLFKIISRAICIVHGWLECQFQTTYIFDGAQKWNIISMNIDALGWHSNHCTIFQRKQQSKLKLIINASTKRHCQPDTVQFISFHEAFFRIKFC